MMKVSQQRRGSAVPRMSIGGAGVRFRLARVKLSVLHVTYVSFTLNVCDCDMTNNRYH